MQKDEFENADAYFNAFLALRKQGIPKNHAALLQAHFKAPNHTATWAQLAKKVGYANGNAVNLQYGKLAKRVAKKPKIRKKPKGFWLYILAGWADERDPVTDHTAFVLRPEVIEALIRLGILSSEDERDEPRLPEEIGSDETYVEGSVRRILVNQYERDPHARRACITYYGTRCFVCSFDFVAAYGEIMVGFIHVHHVKPLAALGKDYKLNPIDDLRPVCPNCHAVLHRRRPAYSLEDVKKFLQTQRSHA